MRKLIMLVLLVVATSYADGLLCTPQKGIEVWWEDYDNVVVIWRIKLSDNSKERLAILPYGNKLDTSSYCLKP
jgi:hypothetical protein